jgi:hypothetical protein
MTGDPRDEGLIDRYCRPTPELVELAHEWRKRITKFERSTGLSLGQPPPVGPVGDSYPVESLLSDGFMDSDGTIPEPYWVGRSPEIGEVLASDKLREAVMGFNAADRLPFDAVQGMRQTQEALQAAARAARDFTTSTGERLRYYYPPAVSEAVKLLATWSLRLPKFAAARTGRAGRPRTGHALALRQVVEALDELKARDGRDLDHEEMTILLMLTIPWRFLEERKPREQFERLVERVRKARAKKIRT